MNLYNHTTCDQPPLLFFFNSPHLRPFLLSLFDSSSPISGRHHEKRGRKQEGSGRNQLPTSPAQDHAPNFLFCRGFGPAFLGGALLQFPRIDFFLFCCFLFHPRSSSFGFLDSFSLLDFLQPRLQIASAF